MTLGEAEWSGDRSQLPFCFDKLAQFALRNRCEIDSGRAGGIETVAGVFCVMGTDRLNRRRAKVGP